MKSMNMNFPSFYYVCKYCKRAFGEASQLLSHKHQCHYEELLRDKKIRKLSNPSNPNPNINIPTPASPNKQHLQHAFQKPPTPTPAPAPPALDYKTVVPTDEEGNNRRSERKSTDNKEVESEVPGLDLSDSFSNASTIVSSDSSREASVNRDGGNDTNEGVEGVGGSSTISSASSGSEKGLDLISILSQQIQGGQCIQLPGIATSVIVGPRSQPTFTISPVKDLSPETETGEISNSNCNNPSQKKRFTCIHCFKKFTTKWNCKVHMATHTGKMPLKCQFCPQIFYKLVEKVAHELTHREKTSKNPQSFLQTPSVLPKIVLAPTPKTAQTIIPKIFQPAPKSQTGISTKTNDPPKLIKLLEEPAPNLEASPKPIAAPDPPTSKTVKTVSPEPTEVADLPKLSPVPDPPKPKSISDPPKLKPELLIPKIILPKIKINFPSTTTIPAKSPQDQDHPSSPKTISGKKIKKAIVKPIGPGILSTKPKKRRKARFAPLTFKCKQCFRSCSSKSALRVHEQRVHYLARSQKCSFCSKSFFSSQERAKHEKLHELNPDNCCKICHQIFSDSSKLLSHMKATHPETDSGTSEGSGLFGISELQSGDQLLPYLDPSGNDDGPRKVFEFGDPEKEEKGKIVKGRGRKGFQCSFCNKIFRLKLTLKVHERIHTGVRPYKCSACPLAFTQSHVLTEHYRTHTGEKPYHCGVCGKRFSHKSSYNMHVKAHQRMKMNKLDVGYCTKTSLDLRNRMKTSSLPKPVELASGITQSLNSGLLLYTCNSCRITFDYRVDANKHWRSHAQEIM